VTLSAWDEEDDMAQTGNRVLDLYRKLETLPLGGALFARALCMQAPYFSTIAPRFVTLEPGNVVVRMKNRRAVHNHIGTVHALAMGNLCELAAGTMMEVTVPATHRWIPKGMDIAYLKKAESDLTASCAWQGTVADAGTEVPVTVHVRDANGEEVSRAVIRMWVTPKKAS
jgi:acyl-coenzyme A thioesterase PaaI-like protein